MNPRVEALLDPNGKVVIGVVNEATLAIESYVVRFDPDYADRGLYEAGPIANALTFANTADAFECWRLQSETHPIRADGKPNRPLTALTVQFGRRP